MRHFAEISVSEAVNYKLPHPDIVGPLTSMGEPCPWPWDPIQLKGQPIGQYHCPYCGEMVIAGIDHIDYREEGDDVG
jgi:hypothetical protein